MSKGLKYTGELEWWKRNEISPDLLARMEKDMISFKPRAPFQETYCVFEFSISGRNKNTIKLKATVKNPEIFGEEIEKHYYLLDETIIRRIKDILFAFNLAYPGLFHIHRGLILRNKEYAGSIHYPNPYSCRIYEECNWLELDFLPLEQCWNWILAKTRFLSFVSREAIDRALFALSYENSSNEDSFVFYVLLGIESIYNDRNNLGDSIRQQIIRKVEALLGKLPPKANKALKVMYEKRSKLFHGSANILKGWESEDYDENELGDILDEQSFIVTATGVLIATIQKLIKADATKIVEHISVSLE